MKKYITCTLLLILSFLIGTKNAYAIIGTAEFVGGEYSTGITWCSKGNGAGECRAYTDHKKVLKINGEKYPAYCLDPGLHLNTGDKYSCTSTADPGLIMLAKAGESGDYSSIQMAMRFYATYKGFGNQDPELPSMEQALVRFIQIRDGWDMKLMCPECSASDIDYLKGNSGLVEEGLRLANQARSASATQQSSTSGLTFTKMPSSTKDRIEYKVTSLSEIDKIKFVCEGCTIQGPDDNFHGKSGTLIVTPAPDCEPFQIKAYYVPKGVYICMASDAGARAEKQILVVSFEALLEAGATGGEIDTSGEPNDIHIDRGIECDPECCTEKELEPNHIEGDINNCCLDNTHSWAKEYELNDLVCYSDEFKVDHYWKMCKSESYIDKKMQGELNEYCDIYCTERVTVDIPGAITATSGRYFDLTTTGQGTKSPYIEGYKRCRTLIHFKKWQDDYREQVEKQVEQYNLYQENRLKDLTYDDAIADTKDCNLKITVDCVGTSGSDSKSDDPTTTADESCSVSIDYTGDTESKDFETGYTQYNFTNPAHNKKNWHSIKLKEEGFKQDADGYYNYYEIIKDKSTKYEHRDKSIWQTIPTIDDANNFVSSKEKSNSVSSKGCSASASVTCTVTYSDTCGHGDEGTHRSLQEDVQSNHSLYHGAAQRAKQAYQSAVKMAKELEEKIDKCDKYFTEYEGTDAESNFPFKAMFFGFEYSQVYLDEYGELKRDVVTVPFDRSPGCQISGPILGPDGEDGLVAPQYSELYFSDEITETTDFGKENIEWEETNEGYKSYLDEEYKADQKFVQDAKYKAVCSWDEPENTKYTLVQKGVVMSAEQNVTKNDRQYHIHLSTLEGSYDTKWLLSGLGTNSKFDAFFAENGEVCSGRQNATEDGLFHCALRVESEIITTGKCNGVKTTISTDECEKAEVPETVLNFKIVDPATVFTCNSVEECGYGYNWFNMPGGTEALSDIRRKGSNVNTYSPQSLSYQVTLNSKDMKQIKNYNRYRENNNYGGYSDFSLICDCPDDAEECHEVGGTQTCKRSRSCRMCRSGFLNNLYNGFVNYGSNHSITGGSGSLESIRSSGRVHWAG